MAGNLLIGPNGAGKSTFFKLISGELHPDKGKIWFRGEDITGLRQHVISHKGISVSYQLTDIFPKLTTLENIRVAAQSRKTTYNFWSRSETLRELRERAESILETVELTPKRNELAGNLSHGEQRHLELGIALATEPSLLLLDEPTAGMSPEDTEKTMQLIRDIARGLVSDPAIMLIDEPTEGLMPSLVDQLSRILTEMNKDGVTILLVEQNVEMALSISSRGYVIDQGVIQFEGSAKDLQQNREIQQRYLGV